MDRKLLGLHWKEQLKKDTCARREVLWTSEILACLSRDQQTHKASSCISRATIWASSLGQIKHSTRRQNKGVQVIFWKSNSYLWTTISNVARIEYMTSSNFVSNWCFYAQIPAILLLLLSCLRSRKYDNIRRKPGMWCKIQNCSAMCWLCGRNEHWLACCCCTAKSGIIIVYSNLLARNIPVCWI